MGSKVFYSVIASGAQLGSAVGIAEAVAVSFHIPTVTSGDFGLYGSFDGTSFAPVVTTSGNWQRPTAAGSVAVALTDEALAYKSIKPLVDVNQAAPRTITIFAKF